MDPSQTKPALAQRIQQAAIVYFLYSLFYQADSRRSVPAPRAPKSKGRRGKGRSGPSGAGRRPKKTVDELDAEMTDYFQNDQNANTA